MLDKMKLYWLGRITQVSLQLKDLSDSSVLPEDAQHQLREAWYACNRAICEIEESKKSKKK